MQNVIILIFLFLNPMLSYSQNTDTMRNEILNYVDKDTEIIDKGRGLLLEKFREHDLLKVKSIKDYLLEETPSTYPVFTEMELIYILYWTQEYDQLEEEILQFRPIILNYRFPYEEGDLVPYDILSKTLEDNSKESMDILIESLQNAELSQIRKDLFILFLKSRFISRFDKNPLINDLSDQFLLNYPNSKYEDLIRNYIRYEYSPSKWSFGYELFAGYSILEDDLSEKFRNPISIGFDLDITYQKWILNGRLGVEISKTQKELNYHNVTWTKGSSATFLFPECSIGYFFEQEAFIIYPFAGVSWVSIEPPADDKVDIPELKDFKIGSVTTYNLGLSLDFKLTSVNLNPYNSFSVDYSFIRLRYCYSLPQFDEDYNGLGGNMHRITIGFGGSTRSIQRVY